MTFGTFLTTLQGQDFGLCIEGFVNIESGNASVASRIFDTSECDCMDTGLGIPETGCEVCLRGPGNFVSCRAGSGDGIYVILGIYPISDSTKRLGALAIFDSGYELAKSARARVEVDGTLGFAKEEIDLMSGDGLAFSPDELEAFSGAKPVLHGSLNSNGAVYFSDDMAHRNAHYAITDVKVDSENLDVIIFGVEEDPYRESLGWEGSDAESEMMRTTMFETLGITPSEPSYFPQVLMVLDSDMATHFDFSDQLPMTDWATSGVHGMASIGTSHLEPMHISTYWVNALLARAKFRLSLIRDEGQDNPGDQHAFEQLMSWAVLGEVSGDADATNLINDLDARDLVAFPEFRTAVLNLRGWDDFPVEESKEAQQFRKSSDGLNTSSGLTKSSSKSGLGLDKPEQQIQGKSASKFCGNCGQRFEAIEANFCSNCGQPR